jgi:membrane protein required for colicin V production
LENINIFDFIVITLTLLLGLKGLFKGFTKEFFGLIGIVGGVFVASRVASDTGNFVNGIIPMSNENTILLAGFVLSLVIFWIAAYFVGAIISKVFSLSGFGIFDRVLGFAFGASKIFLLFAIISYAVSQVKAINDNLKPKLKDSIVFPLLVETGGYIIKLDTGNIQSKVSKELDGVVKSTKETIKEISQKEIKEQVDKKAAEIKAEIVGQISDKK